MALWRPPGRSLSGARNWVGSTGCLEEETGFGQACSGIEPATDRTGKLAGEWSAAGQPCGVAVAGQAARAGSGASRTEVVRTTDVFVETRRNRARPCADRSESERSPVASLVTFSSSQPRKQRSPRSSSLWRYQLSADHDSGRGRRCAAIGAPTGYIARRRPSSGTEAKPRTSRPRRSFLVIRLTTPATASEP